MSQLMLLLSGKDIRIWRIGRSWRTREALGRLMSGYIGVEGLCIVKILETWSVYVVRQGLGGFLNGSYFAGDQMSSIDRAMIRDE